MESQGPCGNSTENIRLNGILKRALAMSFGLGNVRLPTFNGSPTNSARPATLRMPTRSARAGITAWRATSQWPRPARPANTARMFWRSILIHNIVMPEPLTQVPRQECIVEHRRDSNNPLEFTVKSRTRSETEYQVSLFDVNHGGNPSCTCRHYVTTVGPALRRGESRSCWHIDMAERAFLKWIIPIVAAQDKNLPASEQT